VSDCNDLQPTLESYLAGQADDRELGLLLAHCRDCESCRRLLELHRDLSELGARAPAPRDSDFDAMQRRVLQQSDLSGSRRLRAATVWRTAAALAAGLLLFVAGLAVGRGRPEPVAPASGMMARLVAAIDSEAASNRQLSDVEDSRFTYSNVTLRRVEDQRVELEFDLTTHVQLVEPADSVLVREALVQALLHPTVPGSRLKAISLAAGSMEPKVRDALIFAMQRDENLAVRIKALTILAEQLSDGEVESAMLAALRDDESVQMRLLALDCLAAWRIDHERIRRAIGTRERPGDEALLVRLARYEDRL
jgi:hypothetical protein